MQIYDNPPFSNPLSQIVELLAVSGESNFFSSAGWYDLVAKVGSPAGSTMQVYASDDGDAALICQAPPLWQELHSCTNPYTIAYSVLAKPHAEIGSKVRTLARDIALHNIKRPSIRLDGMDLSDLTFSALVQGFRDARFAVKPFFCWADWFEPVSGTSFTEYLSRRPSVLRTTWKRKLTSLQRTAPDPFRIWKSGDDVETFISDYSRVHAGSWKGVEPFPDFVPSLIRHLARNAIFEGGILNIDGKPAAAQFWIIHDCSALLFKLVYATAYRDFSPGTLLTMHMLRHIMERHSPSEISFGRGDDAYKKLWVSSRREHWGLHAANVRTLRGASLAVGMAATKTRGFLTAPFGIGKKSKSH